MVGGSVVVLNFFVKNVNPKRMEIYATLFIRVKLFLNSVVSLSLSLSLFNQIKEGKNHWLSIAVNSLTHYPFGMKNFFFFFFNTLFNCLSFSFLSPFYIFFLSFFLHFIFNFYYYQVLKQSLTVFFFNKQVLQIQFILIVCLFLYFLLRNDNFKSCYNSAVLNH